MLNLFRNKEHELEDQYLYEQLMNLRGYLHEIEHSEMHDPYRKEELIAEITIDIINLEEYIIEKHHLRDMKPFIYTFYAVLILCAMSAIFIVIYESIKH